MEWQSLLNGALQIIVPALATLIAGWFAVLGAKLKASYQAKIDNETAKAVIQDVVRFVQQVYKDLEGAEKLQKAIEQTSTILQAKGINITETEINMLIESAVYGLKEGMVKEPTQELPEVIEENKEEITAE